MKKRKLRPIWKYLIAIVLVASVMYLTLYGIKLRTDHIYNQTKVTESPNSTQPQN